MSGDRQGGHIALVPGRIRDKTPPSFMTSAVVESRVRWKQWLRSRAAWLERGERKTWALAMLVYVVVAAVYFALAPRNLLVEHTQYNHFAHLARAWIDGRLDLAGGPPAYAQNNDFAHYHERWFVAFPPFPAVVLVPFVALAGEPELVRDGQVFLWLAALTPALLFLVLRRLQRLGYSGLGTAWNLALAFSFAWGSVFFFTALQGTVWFAAHVVGATLAAAYLWFAIEARHPLLAGIAIGLGLCTRPPLAFAAALFALESLRVYGGSSVAGAPLWTRCKAWLRTARFRELVRVNLWFALPIVVCLLFTYWHNYARFGDPFETGYQYLTVAWQARMKKWGLFHYHYLARNLAVVLTMLPWASEGAAPFRVNVHGLALWVTTPAYLWLLWPRQKTALHPVLWVTVALVAIPTLFYQNTGWAQFGYRFSNDYAVFLFALLALGLRRVGPGLTVALLLALVVNCFGAVTFGRSSFSGYYHWDGSQKQFYQPD